jgi:cell division protein FtsN
MRKIAKLFGVAFFLAVSAFAEALPPTDLDSLFRGNEFKLPNLDPSYRASYTEAQNSGQSQGKESEAYTLQFGAVANFDDAQMQRAKIQSRTGLSISMTFDAPFYKLRGGIFKKKSEAEDKARELSLSNISAFPVKVSSK